MPAIAPGGQLAHSEVRPASDQCVQLSTIGVSHRRWLTLLGEVGELDAVLSPYRLIISVRCGEMSRDDDDSKIGVLQTVSGGALLPCVSWISSQVRQSFGLGPKPSSGLLILSVLCRRNWSTLVKVLACHVLHIF